MRKSLVGLAVIGLCAAMVACPGSVRQANAEGAGWFLAGSSPQAYEMTMEKSGARTGKGCGSLRSTADKPAGFGTMMQMFDAATYRGKRVRLSAWVKNESVAEWSGVWMRVDGADPSKPLAFDNMQGRPIKGTHDWARYDVVLDVAPEAKNIALGVLLDGPGRVWIDDVKLEAVDLSVATTDVGSKTMAGAPDNLDFER